MHDATWKQHFAEATCPTGQVFEASKPSIFLGCAVRYSMSGLERTKSFNGAHHGLRGRVAFQTGHSNRSVSSENSPNQFCTPTQYKTTRIMG